MCFHHYILLNLSCSFLPIPSTKNTVSKLLNVTALSSLASNFILREKRAIGSLMTQDRAACKAWQLTYRRRIQHLQQTRQEIRHWTPQHGGIACGLRSISRRQVPRAQRRTHLSASWCQGTRSISSFLAWSRQQSLQGRLTLHSQLGFQVTAQPQAVGLQCHPFPAAVLQVFFL
jgi:hypothetical protein